MCAAMKRMLILALACLGQAAWAGQASAEASTCFTPGENCAAFIVRQIDLARSELLVQAYGFTNAAILNAIARAKERGVVVTTLLDKSNVRNGEPERRCIDVLIDGRSGIAHNKVIVIDGRHVITGSFNFTEAAQKRNAENVLLIANDPELAQRFAANFGQLASKARPSEFKPCP
jgi:phospholipase D